MAISEYLRLNKNNCKDCYKCIRSCPVKAITFAGNQAQIIDEECILCGSCYAACPHSAKEIRPDAARVKEAIISGRRVIASVAPSFVAAFDVSGIEDLASAMRRLGFADARETAVGAECVSRVYEEMAAAGQRAVISSACPAINSLIQKYYPDMLGHLAHVLSPMRAHAKAIREEIKDAYVVFVGPCVAKKREADEDENIDACLTFDELKTWLNQSGVTINRAEVTEEKGKRARFYPTVGGILKSMNPVEGVEYLAVDGVENCKAVLEEIRSGMKCRAFIEMSACEGSCIGGPILREHTNRRLNGVMRVSRYAGSEDFGAQPPTRMETSFKQAGLKRILPGNDAIQQVLNRMGKTSPEKELNCGSCGYPTCREKAIAVCQGKAEIEMCLPFLKEKAESFSDKIISSTPNAILVMNEDLIVQQINQAAIRLFRLRSADDIVGAPVVRMLDPTDYLRVVNGAGNIVNKCHYVAEYKLFVEETILYDRQYRILISIMRDVTEREMRKSDERNLRAQTIEVTDKVIEKQMRVVQEIASLLGETTAETKIALTKLKEAMSHDE